MLPDKDTEIIIDKPDEEFPVVIKNSRGTGKLKITKKDAETGDLLEGAEFEVFDEDSNSAGTIFTDEDGIGEIELKTGTYTVREMKAPEQYLKNQEELRITIEESGSLIEKTVLNTREKGTLELIKIDKDTEAALGGAVFQIYDDKENFIIEVTTGENGRVSCELDTGSYILKEKTAPEGYVLNTEIVPFEIRTHNSSVPLTVKNTHKRGKLLIKKTDSQTGEVLEGALFQIYDAEGTPVQKISTDEDGVAQITLNTGKYTLKEVEAPDGYLLPGSASEFEIEKHGQIVEFTVRNSHRTGDLYLEKTDFDTGVPLAGAIVSIFDEDGNEVTREASDENGEISIELNTGNYFMQEISAPEGYLKDDTIIKFLIKDQEEVSLKLANVHKFGTLILYKVDNAAKTPLAGAEFEICSEEGVTIQAAVTDEKGEASIKLNTGKYTLRELKAPEGYLLNEEISSFEITEHEEVVEITVSNVQMIEPVIDPYQWPDYPDDPKGDPIAPLGSDQFVLTPSPPAGTFPRLPSGSDSSTTVFIRELRADSNGGKQPANGRTLAAKTKDENTAFRITMYFLILLLSGIVLLLIQRKRKVNIR